MKQDNSKSINLHIIGLAICLMLSAIFIGKIISTAITYSLENPYNFEEATAEIFEVKEYTSSYPRPSGIPYYILRAEYIDPISELRYIVPLPHEYASEEEAAIHIGEKVQILIDREYQKAVLHTNGSKANGAEIIVFSVLLAICLSISIPCLIVIVRKNKRHWFWVGTYLILMLGLITWVAYSSIDINYLNQL